MQGLMSSYPLTLTHVFQRAERIFPEKKIATVGGDGITRTTYGEWAERTRRLTFASFAPLLQQRHNGLIENPRPAVAPVQGKNRYHGSKPAGAWRSAAALSDIRVSAR